MTLAGSPPGSVPLSGQRDSQGVEVNMPSVFATHGVGELFAFMGIPAFVEPAAPAAALVGDVGITLGAGARPEAVSASGEVGALGALGQYPALVDLAGVQADSVVGRLRADAVFRSVSTVLDGQAANALVGIVRVTTTAWADEPHPGPAKWTDDTTLC